MLRRDFPRRTAVIYLVQAILSIAFAAIMFGWMTIVRGLVEMESFQFAEGFCLAMLIFGGLGLFAHVYERPRY